ncbi:MAG TPA: tetratricopeptide repeat protein [Longimicrobiales bacterium]|nr:tetratricopeptide repeat protein [Longimicrobiales bacterium]
MRTESSLTAVLLLAAACVQAPADDTAIQRGDLAFAAGEMGEALAEYRLAARDERADAEVLARVAHAYTREGEVDDAADFYRRAVDVDPAWSSQAVSDLMLLAEQAQVSGDRFRMASAVEAAQDIEPGVGLEGLALPLARHHFQNGEYGQSLPLYQRALAAGADSVPEVMFEIGQAHEEIGDCERALIFFEQFRESVSRRERQRSGVDWYIGSCSFQVAEGLHGSDRPTEDVLLDALSAVDRTIEMGEPRNLQGRAWFERGQILADLGRCEEAIESFRQVRAAEGNVQSALATRAQERLDDLRFRSDVRRRLNQQGC